ncbi:MAG: hypothetical protein AAF569_01375 [Pseudomonadota bacterium]
MSVPITYDFRSTSQMEWQGTSHGNPFKLIIGESGSLQADIAFLERLNKEQDVKALSLRRQSPMDNDAALITELDKLILPIMDSQNDYGYEMPFYELSMAPQSEFPVNVFESSGQVLRSSLSHVTERNIKGNLPYLARTLSYIHARVSHVVDISNPGVSILYYPKNRGLGWHDDDFPETDIKPDDPYYRCRTILYSPDEKGTCFALSAKESESTLYPGRYNYNVEEAGITGRGISIFEQGPQCRIVHRANPENGSYTITFRRPLAAPSNP